MGQSTGAAPFHFSTDSIPERDRLTIFREEVARQALRVDVEPLDDQPFHAELASFALEDFRLFRCSSSALQFDRTQNLIPPNEASVGIVFSIGGPTKLLQRGREVVMAAGDAVVISHQDPARLIRSSGRHVGIVMPCTSLEPVVGGMEAAYGRLIHRDNEALQLLYQYLGILRDDMANASAGLRHVVATHIRDLVALAIGFTHGAGSFSSSGGLRAARLRAIKADIEAGLQFDISARDVAAAHRISERYLQRLFEEDGATFTSFVLDARLALARRLLRDPAHAARSIGSIAVDAGFNDISYFNRRFRGRYGCTPSDIRRAGDHMA